MLVTTLDAICRKCIALGLVRTRADFAKEILNRYDRYMALCMQRGGWVPRRTTTHAIGRLESVMVFCPAGLRRDVQAIIEEANRGIEVARMFRR